MPGKRLYRFLGYQLDPVRRVIDRDGDLLPMPPKVVDTLIVLVERAGDVVDKDTLMRMVWPDTNVVGSSLTRNISLLRKALAEGGNGEAIIQTVSRRGYRFLPRVEIVAEPDVREASEEQGTQSTQGTPGTPAPPPAVMPAIASAARPTVRALVLIGLFVAGGIMAIVVSVMSPVADRRDLLTDAEREYLVGRHFWNKVEPAHVERALARFERAAALDPDSALAHAGVADSHVLMIQLAMTSRARSLAPARAAAERAIALDPTLALPHASLGYVAAITERRQGVDAGTRRWTELLIPAIAVGDRDLAIRALEEMWKTREIELLHLQVDPRFDPLRADARFQSLTKRVFGGV